MLERATGLRFFLRHRLQGGFFLHGSSGNVGRTSRQWLQLVVVMRRQSSDGIYGAAVVAVVWKIRGRCCSLRSPGSIQLRSAGVREALSRAVGRLAAVPYLLSGSLLPLLAVLCDLLQTRLPFGLIWKVKTREDIRLHAATRVIMIELKE